MNSRAIVSALLSATLAAAAEEPAKKPLHPEYPVVEGVYQMTDNWSVTLDQQHNRRIGDGSLVLWRPGFTIWTMVWNGKEGETPEQRLKSLKEGISGKATEVKVEKDGKVMRISYRLDEGSEDKRKPAFYGFAVGPDGHVQMSVYFDDEKDAAKAQEIFKSLAPVDPEKPRKGSPAPKADDAKP